MRKNWLKNYASEEKKNNFKTLQFLILFRTGFYEKIIYLLDSIFTNDSNEIQNSYFKITPPLYTYVGNIKIIFIELFIRILFTMIFAPLVFFRRDESNGI
jgi:hypothetical protein